MKTKLVRGPERFSAMYVKLKQAILDRKTAETKLKKSVAHYDQLLKQSHLMQEHLRHLSRQIILAHEEERKNISRELHDEIGQILTGINIRLAALRNETSDNTRTIKKKIVTAQRLVEKSMKQIHRFARELRPAVLDDMGLMPALHAHVKDFSKQTHIPVYFKSFTIGKISVVNNLQRTAFYRVAQEALINVAKHAKASRVDFRLEKSDGCLIMKIKNNGKSFQVEHVLRARKRERLGLLGMRERMEMIGGQFTIESKAGQGTTVCAKAPLKFPKQNSKDNQRQKGFK
ncbi:MAG: hypothetical protein COV74_00925 [Candidatus Omnitrophica bacterium CG11_big_fil_rev_8_21_14_0_20_45_26]|uniref:histidine kinase n=1 Tax=Candidatus Abzuiibacterium crystallinum TaxID=1974748 RepID=A0A2H0LSQ4_9BACT|nr:MAG: hypothetical protein COV74_00925 [Candidatus Omnitrophica bacterium CG11_big_fil_rev_8_21_14_0_20_45_26]PIW64406.1 MAG: hypothetical protein COW12_06335 [Candidatus Omnitrophica bacterium CG12_big_fil_rev_8_21_14_0_65_45_16]